jgi:CheY-like chemotaxis protein
MAWRDQGYLTVLVIDDDPAIRDLVARLILSEGHQVVAVGSAEAGLEQLPFFTFEVALLDHRLPGMEGLVLGEYLHRNNPSMEVALMTGDADPRLAQVAHASGLEVLMKPFELEDITRFLERAVAKERARQHAGCPAAADPEAGHPIDLAPHFLALGRAFASPSVSQRIEELLARRVREALEAIRYGDSFDERARAIAYSGIIAAEVLGIHLPRPKHHSSMAAWYDSLMHECGRPSAFGTEPV